MREGAELLVADGRLTRGERYAVASPSARRSLARVGAILRLRERGRYYVHASGVVDPLGRAWLLAGDSGSGKSTLAYALARLGWPVLGDDGVVVEQTGASFVAHAWRDPLRVSLALSTTFPEIDSIQGEPERDDARQRIPVPVSGIRRAAVGALLFVSRGEQDQLHAMEPAIAFGELLRQSPWVLLNDTHSREHFRALHTLLTTVPVLALSHTASGLGSLNSLLLAAVP